VRSSSSPSGKKVGQPLHDVVEDALDLLFEGHAAAAAAAARCELGGRLEESVGLCGHEVDLRVGVETVAHRRLVDEVLINVLDKLLVVERRRRHLELGVEREAVQEAVVHVRREVGCAEPAVPVVGDVAAVHALPEEVLQVGPRHLGSVV